MLNGDQGAEIPLERLESGRLTDACRERVISILRNLVKKPRLWPRQPALCAIGARGVSLRRLTLPPASREEFVRLLRLQIEREFPLSPDELAWGYLPAGKLQPAEAAPPGSEVVVAALKKEAVEEYLELLSAAGFTPTFTLAALARGGLTPQPFRPYSVLDIGQQHSELVSFDNRVPTAIRILSWGGEDITRSIAKALNVSRDEAEKMKLQPRPSLGNGDAGAAVRKAIESAVDSLARLLERGWVGEVLYLSGKSTQLPEVAARLGEAFAGKVECRSIEGFPGEGRSAATLGLKTYLQVNGGSPPLTFDLRNKQNGELAAGVGYRKWALLAAALVLCAFFLRYAEPVLFSPGLAKRVREIKAYREDLPKIDRQLNFLKFLETNQPAYLDALLVLGNAAGPGTRFDNVSINRRGELALRATMQTPQAAEFRSKLIDSGFFSTVVVEEQNPTPDRQRVVVRITAQSKPAATRPKISVPPSPGPTDKRPSGGPGAAPTRPGPTFPGQPPPGFP